MTILGFPESFVISGFFFSKLIAVPNGGISLPGRYFYIYVLTAFAYIGAFVGDQSSYLMGRIFGSKMLKWNIFKKRTKQVEKTKTWFDKYKFGAILLGRMTPSIRPFAPFFVGTFRLNYRTFLFFDLIACTVWASGLVLLVILWEYIGSLF